MIETLTSVSRGAFTDGIFNTTSDTGYLYFENKEKAYAWLRDAEERLRKMPEQSGAAKAVVLLKKEPYGDLVIGREG